MTTDKPTIKFHWRCPYCGADNFSVTTLSGQNLDERAAYCDSEEVNGCGQMVFLQPLLRIKVLTYKVTLADDCESEAKQ